MCSIILLYSHLQSVWLHGVQRKQKVHLSKWSFSTSIKLNTTHVYLAESGEEGLKPWRRAHAAKNAEATCSPPWHLQLKGALAGDIGDVQKQILVHICLHSFFGPNASSFVLI